MTRDYHPFSCCTDVKSHHYQEQTTPKAKKTNYDVIILSVLNFKLLVITSKDLHFLKAFKFASIKHA